VDRNQDRHVPLAYLNKVLCCLGLIRFASHQSILVMPAFRRR
jgi:hypothetical protein